MAILSAIARERGRAVLVVTHDPRLFGFADRIVTIEDGALTGERYNDTGSGGGLPADVDPLASAPPRRVLGRLAP
jgi:putative ABC transport system ATP-binding protein